MSLETVTRPFIDQCQAAIAAGTAVDGEKMLHDMQRAQARDMAEELMLKATTSPGMTSERLLEMRDQALGIALEAWHSTLAKHGHVPDEMMEAIAGRMWEAFAKRLDEISTAGGDTRGVQ